jgi:putative FmdB family regulatory protein
MNETSVFIFPVLFFRRSGLFAVCAGHPFLTFCPADLLYFRKTRHKVHFLSNRKTFGKGILSMPIYEFECQKCGRKFEKLVLGSDEKPPECPDCSSTEVHKLMSAGSRVTLKVPGGYGGNATAPSCAPGG